MTLAAHRELLPLERQRAEPATAVLARRHGQRGALVADVGLTDHGVRHAGGGRQGGKIDERGFVGHGDEDQVVRAGVPPGCRLGVLDGELEGGVCRLCGL